MHVATTDAERIAARAQDELRLRAFRVFYAKTFCEEKNLLVRFVKALLASAGPIRDPDAMAEWCRQHGRSRAARQQGDQVDRAAG